MREYEVFMEDINSCGGEQHAKKELIEVEADGPEAYVKKKTEDFPFWIFRKTQMATPSSPPAMATVISLDIPLLRDTNLDTTIMWCPIFLLFHAVPQPFQQVALQIESGFKMHKLIRIPVPQKHQLGRKFVVALPKLQQHRKEGSHGNPASHIRPCHTLQQNAAQILCRRH